MTLSKEEYLPVNTSSTDIADRADGGDVESQSDMLSMSVDHERRPVRSRKSKYLHSIGRVAILGLAAWGFIAICVQTAALFQRRFVTKDDSSSAPSTSSPYFFDVYRPSTYPPGLNLCDCGTTLAEAHSKQCVYDVLAAAWLPPHCRDSELTQQFEHAGPEEDGGRWLYFADKNGTIPMTVSEVSLLGPSRGTFWATREWHVSHCLFYWEKYWRMRTTGIIMEKKFDTLHHVHHCRMLALNKQPEHRLLLEVPVSMNGEIEP